MDKTQPNRLSYPIRTINYGDFPLLDELLGRGRTVIQKTGFDRASKRRFHEGFNLATGESLVDLLEKARASGRLEPLASLVYSLIPAGAEMAGTPSVHHLLVSYQQQVDGIMRDLSKNITFQAQVTPDNIWGEAILANGLLLMKSGGSYIAYRYSIQEGKMGKQVVFERLPDLKSADLETTIKRYHNPESIESPVLVRSRRPYHAKEDILPFFAYSLTGLKK